MRLLIVCNTPSKNLQILKQASINGANGVPDSQLEIYAPPPLQATATDVINADGIFIGTSENFGYMSGLIKDFLERIYYPCLDITQGKPLAVYVKGGLDGQGAASSIERVITGLRWKLVQPVLVLKGDFQPEFESQCYELGEYMAAGLDAKIF